ncbi:14 kDa proline-rich protein DC2.15-like [Juglans microcarpa x Juglans regia]|uniref:14 kDa proline-rich protein DC2.15-like n=1 Tax=Juglans microcarpa x Juglans regia TaxID=2249226 RepID=UPI001B7D9E3D|nr:14 kDa proline-rich protein DC2.15-like [Juglans microcarpa x Juglans regia]
MAASKKLSATILVISLLFQYATFSSACGTCRPKPTPPAKCPNDTLKLGVCVDLLGLVNLQIGSPISSKCCALLAGLADLEAALCLCTAIKANVLGINLNVPLTLSLLVSACQKSVPPGFVCE